MKVTINGTQYATTSGRTMATALICSMAFLSLAALLIGSHLRAEQAQWARQQELTKTPEGKKILKAEYKASCYKGVNPDTIEIFLSADRLGAGLDERDGIKGAVAAQEEYERKCGFR